MNSPFKNPLITGKDITWPSNKLIVSKTDLSGRISYANRQFMQISGYHERELIGTQHNILRHAFMPRGAFKLMWKFLKNKQEFFAFVINETKNKDYYWVFAHITPIYDDYQKVIGYYSVRRVMPESLKPTIIDLYEKALGTEKGLSEKQATEASYNFLTQFIKDNDLVYNDFICDLYRQHV
jgi:aerotaxis receptor